MLAWSGSRDSLNLHRLRAFPRGGEVQAGGLPSRSTTVATAHWRWTGITPLGPVRSCPPQPGPEVVDRDAQADEVVPDELLGSLRFLSFG